MTARVSAVWELYTAGTSPAQIATTLGIHVRAVHNRLRRARDELGVSAGFEDADDNAPRCRCGLRLPCEDCLPSLAEVALSRDWNRV